MLRRLATVVAWILALVLVTIYVGMRVRAHRLADPAQALRPYLVWFPAALAQRAVMASRQAGADGLALQIELPASAAELRELVARNGFEPVAGPLIGSEAERWQIACPGRPEAVVHLLQPGAGAPLLLTVVDPRGGR